MEKAADQSPSGQRKEWLLVWAGDENIADTVVKDVKNLPGSIEGGLDKVKNSLPGPDFLAVIDATKGSPDYGKVVNTATVGPLVENEPHHVQYTWHKGDTIFAGALFGAAAYAFDATQLPSLKLKGISLPTQTLGGSVPGPYTYSDGSTHISNGFAGSPGEVVRFDENARVLSQPPAATPQGDNEKLCDTLPRLGKPTCANPHGIQAREDLNTLVTSDYAEPQHHPGPGEGAVAVPAPAHHPHLGHLRPQPRSSRLSPTCRTDLVPTPPTRCTRRAGRSWRRR